MGGCKVSLSPKFETANGREFSMSYKGRRIKLKRKIEPQMDAMPRER
jgi:hypothetical protein